MATTYREIVVRGNEDVMRGFLACYRSAHRIKSGLILARNHPINRHHLKEVLTFRANYLHLIVSSEHYRGLIFALRPVLDELKLTIMYDRPIRRAWFEYKFETYNRRVAGTIKRLFHALSGEVRRVGHVHKESVDPRSKGVEMYSASHEYVFHGEGELVGGIDTLLLLHAKFKAHEFVDVKDISLKP